MSVSALVRIRHLPEKVGGAPVADQPPPVLPRPVEPHVDVGAVGAPLGFAPAAVMGHWAGGADQFGGSNDMIGAAAGDEQVRREAEQHGKAKRTRAAVATALLHARKRLSW